MISNPSAKQLPEDAVRKDMKPMRGVGPSPRILACADAKAEGRYTLITVFSSSSTANTNESINILLYCDDL